MTSGGGYTDGMFHRAYSEGAAPWDIGRPQPEIVALAEAGTFGHRVVDLGCGTGEQALMLAARGHEVLGIDAVPEAIERARRKAEERGIDAQFIAGDLFEVLPLLGRSFDSAVDVGLFHTLSDEDRVRFSVALGRVLVPGALYVMLCFSDRVPGEFGPRRVSEAEIRNTFRAPEFAVREVRAAGLHSLHADAPVIDANLARIERLN